MAPLRFGPFANVNLITFQVYSVTPAFIPGEGWACLFTPAGSTTPPATPATATLTVELTHSNLPGPVGVFKCANPLPVPVMTTSATLLIVNVQDSHSSALWRVVSNPDPLGECGSGTQKLKWRLDWKSNFCRYCTSWDFPFNLEDFVGFTFFSLNFVPTGSWPNWSPLLTRIRISLVITEL